MNRQIFMYGLTEGGEVFTRTIYESDAEALEKEGFQRNPLALPGSVERLSTAIVIQKEAQLEHLETVKKGVLKAGIVDEEDEEDLAAMDKAIELLSDEIKEKKESKSLSEKEIGEWGECSANITEVENFLLNVDKMRSKNKITVFVEQFGHVVPDGLSLKELRKFARVKLNG